MDLPKKLYHGNARNMTQLPLSEDGFLYTTANRDEAMWRGAKMALHAILGAQVAIHVNPSEIVVKGDLGAFSTSVFDAIKELHFTLYEIPSYVTNGFWSKVEDPSHHECWRSHKPLHIFNDRRELRLIDVYRGRQLTLLPNDGQLFAHVL